jgi:hypothetical protein
MRYAELQAAGGNPDEHNFLAEWIPYWGIRLRELASKEIQARRLQLMMQFGLGEIYYTNSDPLGINFCLVFRIRAASSISKLALLNPDPLWEADSGPGNTKLPPPPKKIIFCNAPVLWVQYNLCGPRSELDQRVDQNRMPECLGASVRKKLCSSVS